MAVIVGVGALRRGNPLPLGVAVFIITAGLVETLHSWNYWTFYSAMMVWSVLAADPQTEHASLSLQDDSRR